MEDVMTALDFACLAMTGNVADLDQQSVQQGSDIVGLECAVARSRTVDQVSAVPLPVWGKHLYQSCCLGAFVAQAAGIGIGKRSVDIETDVAGTPSVGKSDIEQVR